jgi:small subunit ribosomal protein S20
VANIKSQKKRIITNEQARLRNKTVRSQVKTAEKNVLEAVEAGEKDAAVEQMQHASRLYDKAVSKGVLPKNRAANHKSKLARMIDGIDA